MADATNTTTPSALSANDINSTINGEPRIQDARLAVALGFKRPADIRPLIERHEEALKRLGGIFRTVRKNAGRGRPSSEFWLTKKQALYITTKAETERATEITIMVVEVFDAATSPTNPQPSLALPPPSSEPCPPFCDGCWARKQWLTGENTIHNPNPLVDAPLDCADLRMLATLRPLVARTVRLQIGNRILDATIAMQNALSGKDGNTPTADKG